MNITWLDINASYSHSSLALPSLEAQLQSQTRSGCKIEVVSGTLKTPVDDVLMETIESNPDYILATAWLFNVKYLLSILSRIHSIDKNIKIVLGGPEFMGNNFEFLSGNPYVTAVFKGEGEEIFNEFIKMVSQDPASLEWRKLEGFEYIENGRYHLKKSAVVREFQKLIPPESSLFFRWDKAFVQLETSRGCFNSCRFCVSGIDSASIQDLDIEQIKIRLDNICSKGIREIRILDRTFNANSKRAVEMLTLFEEYYGKLKFHIEVHPALLSPAVRNKLANIPEGLLHIEAGIQSLDETVLVNCARKGTSKQSIEGLKFLLSTEKFEVHTDFIAGLPGYTFDMLLSDVKRMIAISPDEIQLELLKLLPGTHFRIYSERYGISFSPEPPYEVLKSDSLSYKETVLCKVLSKIIEYWYNDSSWRSTFRKIVISDERFLEDMLMELFASPFHETLHSFESKSMLLYLFCKKHYPEYTDHIVLNWVMCGLSLKKEPASQVRHWNIKDMEQISNPLFDPVKRTNSYYYFDSDNTRYWFTFNKSEERCKPIKFHQENINNCKQKI
ncbi:MAG: DUF4080 domain-containing protein [Bacteroidales bacterium]|nr:DUF4080 domain-containing protein [Bacteroidales bacterium]